MSHSHLGFRARRHPSGVREGGMKTLCEFRIGRTIIVTGAMFAWAWASQQAHSQNSDAAMAVVLTQNMRLRNAFTCRQYKTWLALRFRKALKASRIGSIGWLSWIDAWPLSTKGSEFP